MKMQFRNGKHSGYMIGKDIKIHNLINDLDSWFLTIRPLKIFGEYLCSKELEEKEIARYVYQRVNKDLLILNSLMKEVNEFT